MSNRLNIRKKKVKKLPRGKFRYQVVLKFKPTFYQNNESTYNNIVELLQASAMGDWHVPKARPSGFKNHLIPHKKNYIRNMKSAQVVYLEEGMDLAILKLCHSHEMKNIYELELIS